MPTRAVLLTLFNRTNSSSIRRLLHSACVARSQIPFLGVQATEQFSRGPSIFDEDYYPAKPSCIQRLDIRHVIVDSSPSNMVFCGRDLQQVVAKPSLIIEPPVYRVGQVPLHLPNSLRVIILLT